MNQGSGRYPDSACLSIWLNVKLRCLGDGCLGGRDAGRGSPGKGMACLSDSFFSFLYQLYHFAASLSIQFHGDFMKVSPVSGAKDIVLGDGRLMQLRALLCGTLQPVDPLQQLGTSQGVMGSFA